MSLRSRPTARQVRLGIELRKLREGAGVTGRDAARVIGVDQARITHIEAGRAAIPAERVHDLTNHYGSDNPALVRALTEMTGERATGWWRKFEGTTTPALLDLASLEYHAQELRTLQVAHVPGLLQTEGYIRAMLSQTMPELSAVALDELIAFRLARQQILDRPSPAPFTAVIHEAALRIKVADRSVARRQLEALAEASTRPSIDLRIVPFDRDGFTGSGFSMLYIAGPALALDTAQFDTVHGSIFEHESSRLASYRNVLDRVKAMALPGAASRDFVDRITKEL